MNTTIHCLPYDLPNPTEPACMALDALSDQLPEHISTLSLERPSDAGSQAPLLVRYGIDARALASDPNAANDVLAFLEKSPKASTTPWANSPFASRRA